MRLVLPPTPVRRLLIAPAMILLTAAVLGLSPIVLLCMAFAVRFLPGRWRALRLLWIVVIYAVIEALLLVVMFGFWFASGFGHRVRTPYWQGIHYDLVEGVMWVFFREAKRVLNLDIVTDGPTPDAHPWKPILVCCPSQNGLVVEAPQRHRKIRLFPSRS